MRRALVIVGFSLCVGSMALSSACDDDDESSPLPGSSEAGADANATPPTEDASGAEADAPSTCTLPVSYGSKRCNECMQTACCTEIAACEADPACKPLQKCVVDCRMSPDAGGCRDDCYAAQPSGKALWLKVQECWFKDLPVDAAESPYCGPHCS
jgi:hypothetical protein